MGLSIPSNIAPDSISTLFETGTANPSLNLQLFFPFYNVLLLQISAQYIGNVNGTVKNPDHCCRVTFFRFSTGIRTPRAVNYNGNIGSGPAISWTFWPDSTQYYPFIMVDGVLIVMQEALNAGDASAIFNVTMTYARTKDSKPYRHTRKRIF